MKRVLRLKTWLSLYRTGEVHRFIDIDPNVNEVEDVSTNDPGLNALNALDRLTLL